MEAHDVAEHLIRWGQILENLANFKFDIKEFRDSIRIFYFLLVEFLNIFQKIKFQIAKFKKIYIEKKVFYL